MTHDKSRADRIREHLISACLVLVILMALTVLYGWIQNIEIYKTLLPGRPDMKANAAVCFFSTALAIGLVRWARTVRMVRYVSCALALITLVFAGLVLIEYAANMNLGIDEILFKDPNGNHGHSPAGRFSPLTATNFILIGSALLFDLWGRRPWARTSQALVALSFLVSFQSFLGHLLGMSETFGMSLFIPMALPTSLSFVLLATSYLGSRWNEGFMERFSAATPSAVMARRMLALVILVPPLIRALASYGARAGLYAEPFSAFLQVMGALTFMSVIVISTSGALLRIERERERLREREREAYREAQVERDRLYAVLRQAPTHVDMYRGPDLIYELAHPLTVEAAGGGDIRGKKLSEVFPDAEENGVIQASKEVFRSGVPYFGDEVLIKLPQSDGTDYERFFNISIQPWRDSKGEIVGVITFSVDVTDQVKARKAVEESREEARRNADQLRLVTDALPTLIAYVGRDGRYQLVNETYQKWFGFPKSYFIGKTLEEILPAETLAKTTEALPRVLGGESVNFQNIYMHGDSLESHVDVNFIPDRDHSGDTRGFVIVSRDVTQTMRHQKELKRAKDEAEEASLAKSQFLANMSHEIRTPLGIILGFSDLALESIQRPEEAQGYLLSIRRNAEELSKLLGEILDLSKVEAKKLDIEKIRFPLLPIIDEVRALLDGQARDKGIGLRFEYEGAIPGLVESDPTRLRQILINLVGNAIKFTQEGSVRVLVSADAPEAGTCASLKVRFEVRDTGIGISPSQRDRLFKPFSQADSSMTRKFGGTGLGLMLSKQLALALGGDLDLIDSQPGKGSVFIASIDGGPVRPDTFLAREASESRSGRSASQLQAARLDGLRVLLVEDSVENQILVSRYLKATGARVTLADNGQEGVQKTEQREFDVILMDIQMPIMDGFKATSLLRERGHRGPIIALTAHAVQEEREKALRSGFDGYLTKPLNKSQLMETLAGIQQKRTPANQNHFEQMSFGNEI